MHSWLIINDIIGNDQMNGVLKLRVTIERLNYVLIMSDWSIEFVM